MASFSFSDINSSLDRNSQFFQQLTAPLPATTPSRTLRWPAPTSSSSPSSIVDLSSIVASINSKTPKSRRESLQESDEPNEKRKTIQLNKHSFGTLYQPTGKWEWIKNLPLVEKEATFLSDGAMCNAYIKKGEIGGKTITYVCKSWKTSTEWNDGFYLEMGLYKTHLRPLQGVVVPYIISLFTAPGFINVAMEPPHHSFWIEASTDMPLILKQRCVEAFEKLHACGVLHGDVELRHMLIGGDARVTLIDFQESGALVPIPQVGVRQVHEAELKRELRKVKVKLDFPGARDHEYARFTRYVARQSKGEPDLLEDLADPPIKSLQEWGNWTAVPQKPNRFLVPGQTSGTIHEEIQTFLKLIESSSSSPDPTRSDNPRPDPSPRYATHRLDGKPHTTAQTALSCPSLHSATDHEDPIIDLSTTSPTPRDHSRGDASSVSRATESSLYPPKRSVEKQLDIPGALSPIHVNRAAVPSPITNASRPLHDPPAVTLGKRRAEEDVDSDSRLSKRRILDSLPSNVSLTKRPTPSENSDVIEMKNLAECIANQLPHPTLLELFPNNPRWQKPDVQFYLEEQMREIQKTIIAAKKYPDRHYRLPRPIRSFGPLKRRMDEIRCVVQVRTAMGPSYSSVDRNAESHDVSLTGAMELELEDTSNQIDSSIHLDLTNPSRTTQSDKWYHSIRWIGNVVRMWR